MLATVTASCTHNADAPISGFPVPREHSPGGAGVQHQPLGTVAARAPGAGWLPAMSPAESRIEII